MCLQRLPVPVGSALLFTAIRVTEGPREGAHCSRYCTNTCKGTTAAEKSSRHQGTCNRKQSLTAIGKCSCVAPRGLRHLRGHLPLLHVPTAQSPRAAACTRQGLSCDPELSTWGCVCCLDPRMWVPRADGSKQPRARSCLRPLAGLVGQRGGNCLGLHSRSAAELGAGTRIPRAGPGLYRPALGSALVLGRRGPGKSAAGRGRWALRGLWHPCTNLESQVPVASQASLRISPGS